MTRDTIGNRLAREIAKRNGAEHQNLLNGVGEEIIRLLKPMKEEERESVMARVTLTLCKRCWRNREGQICYCTRIE